MELALPQEWTALCAVVFLLGLRHGFDADHLATIDGLTRYNAAERPRLARACGTLFSLGHGAVVMAVALGVSLLSSNAPLPAWLEGLGSAISVLFLLILGSANLAAVLRTPPDAPVRPVGIKGGLLGRLRQSAHPGLVALVGALFALSFDTLSQAMLFALTATHFGGWQHTLVLGGLFLLGMLVIDGINGLWIARLLRRADATALRASRLMGLTVAGISFAVAGVAIARWLSPAMERWQEDWALFSSLAILALLGTSFVVAMRIRSGGLLGEHSEVATPFALSLSKGALASTGSARTDFKRHRAASI